MALAGFMPEREERESAVMVRRLRQESGQLLCLRGQCPFTSPDAAGHVLPATHRRFDLAVIVGAFRNLYFVAVVQGQHVVDKGSVAFGTGGVDGHAAFFAFVGCHGFSFGCRLGEYSQKRDAKSIAGQIP